MTAFARVADYAKCRELFIAMITASIEPDNGHFNALMSACASAADAETAQAVFDQMPLYNLTPQSADWTILISCYRNGLGFRV